MPNYGRATVAEYALWASGTFVTHLDVWIERVVGGVTQFQSYRDFGGWYWIRTLNFGDSGVDVPIGSGTLVLHRQRGGDSLSPLVTASPLNMDGGAYSPAIEFGREIVIRTADTPTLGSVTLTAGAALGAVSITVQALARGVGIGSILHFPQGQVRVTASAAASATSVSVSPLPAAVPNGTKAKISHEPMEADWKVRFVGVTDDPDWGGRDSDKVSVPFRDRNGTLSDTYVRASKVYGTEAGTPILDVSQELVDDGMGVGQYVLETTPAPPSFNVTRYEVTEVSVWEALEKLGDQPGAVFRQAWSYTASEYRTILVTPPREKVLPDYEVTPSTYLDVHHISTGSANLRTIVRVYGVEAGTGAELVHQVPAEELVSSDAKVLQYGPRYLQLSEDNTSAIDTQAELEAFGNAVYADVSSPPIPLEIETKYCWFAEPDQLVRWKANGKLWDEGQDSAVLSLTHDFPSPGVARTRWKTAGKPKGRYASWMNQGVAIAGRQAKPPSEALARLIDFLPRQRLSDGSLEVGFIRGPGTSQVWSGAVTFLGPETEAMWEQVREAVRPNSGDTFTVPPAPEGYVTLGQVEAISPAGTVGEVWRVRLTGTAAPASFLVNLADSADGLSSTVTVLAFDPRGITRTPLVYLTQPGQVESDAVAMVAGLPGVWSYAVTLHPQHNVGVRIEVPRTDGGETFRLGPYSLDRNKIPSIPDVREERELYSDQVTLVVDSPDSDTASLWYREELAGGALGAETSIPARVLDIRFGQYAITLGDTERAFRVYAKNSAAVPGEYRHVKVRPRELPPPDTTYAQVQLRIVSSNATTVTVEATTDPAGGTVTLVAVTGSAVRLSGPLAGVASPSGSVWVFTRGAINAGAGQAEFRGEVAGSVGDSDFVTIEEQGRDTVALQVLATMFATSATSVTARVAVADPYPGGDIVVSYVAAGVGGVTPASPVTYAAADITSVLATTKYVDFVIPRGAAGSGTGRVVFTASRAGRVTDSDAIDVPEQAPTVLVYAECLATIVDSDATTVTVQVTGSVGTQVQWLSSGGSATYVSGPAPLTPVASGSQWVFGRGAFGTGVGQALFIASGGSQVPDTDSVTIEEQGRDTVPLQMRAKLLSTTPTQAVVRVAVADPHPASGITITQASDGTGTVSPASGSILAGAVTNSLETTGYVDFTVPFGTRAGRVDFTCTSPGRTPDSDALDTPSVTAQNGIAEVTSATETLDGETSHITVYFDPDTVLGTGVAQYRLGGGSPVAIDVETGRVSRFDVTRSSTSTQLLEIRGRNGSGTYNPDWHELPVSKYDPLPKMLLSVDASVVDHGLGELIAYNVDWAGIGLADATQHVEISVFRGSTLVAEFEEEPQAGTTVYEDEDGGVGAEAAYYATISLIRTADTVRLGPVLSSIPKNSFVVPTP
jgi:hypothetical protein